MTDNELKPCPFCGNKEQDNFIILDSERVICGRCGAIGPLGKTAEEAKAAWNMRPE